MNRRKILNAIGICTLGILGSAIVGVYTSESPRLSKFFSSEQQPYFVVRVGVERDNQSDHGTGTLIRSDLILTAWHVVSDARPGDPIYVVFKDGMRRAAKVIRKQKDVDLALLEIEPVMLPAARPAAKSAVKGQEVVICGFPGNAEYKEVRGRVNGTKGTSDRQGVFFTVSNRTQSGMSGGPVLNVSNEVVGMLWGSLRFAHCTHLDVIKEFLSDVE